MVWTFIDPLVYNFITLFRLLLNCLALYVLMDHLGKNLIPLDMLIKNATLLTKQTSTMRVIYLCGAKKSQGTAT